MLSWCQTDYELLVSMENNMALQFSLYHKARESQKPQYACPSAFQTGFAYYSSIDHQEKSNGILQQSNLLFSVGTRPGKYNQFTKAWIGERFVWEVECGIRKGSCGMSVEERWFVQCDLCRSFWWWGLRNKRPNATMVKPENPAGWMRLARKVGGMMPNTGIVRIRALLFNDVDSMLQTVRWWDFAVF